MNPVIFASKLKHYTFYTCFMSIVRTATGEPYQPTRVYYTVYDRDALLAILDGLRCMVLDLETQEWQWIFDYEARRLRFERIFHKIPRADRPVILGCFQFQTETELCLTTYSFDRLLQGILFFDKHVPRSTVKVERMRLVNRFFSQEEVPQLPPHAKLDAWFNRSDIRPHRANEVMEKLEQLITDYPEAESRQKAVSDYLDTLEQIPRPEIEELPVNFYEDGVISLELVLNTRRAEAQEKWRKLKAL